MNKNNYKFGLIILLALIPILSYGAGLKELVKSATSLITGVLIPMAYSICLLYFFWGLVKYINNSAGSEDASKEGRRIMVWGVIALFVVTSIWGIVSFIKAELLIPGTNTVSPIKLD